MEDQALFSLYLGATAKANHNVVIPLSAKWSNERMLVQQGLFVMPSNITKSFMDNMANIAIVEDEPILHKLTLPSAERMKVLRDLDQMNINDMSLFPGLEGYARSMSRRLLLQAFAIGQA